MRFYLAAVFVSGNLAGLFVSQAENSPPVFMCKHVAIWTINRSRSVDYLLRCAEEYRRGRHFNGKPMSEWRALK